jgi:hypothetical protein
VLTMSLPLGGTGLRGLGAAGVPTGCAGCPSRSVRRPRPARGAAAGALAFACGPLRRDATAPACFAVRFPRVGVVRGCAGVAVRSGASAVGEASPPVGVRRFWLRRWGRVRGSALRTSAGGSSVIQERGSRRFRAYQDGPLSEGLT